MAGLAVIRFGHGILLSVGMNVNQEDASGRLVGFYRGAEHSCPMAKKEDRVYTTTAFRQNDVSQTSPEGPGHQPRELNRAKFGTKPTAEAVGWVTKCEVHYS